MRSGFRSAASRRVARHRLNAMLAGVAIDRASPISRVQAHCTRADRHAAGLRAGRHDLRGPNELFALTDFRMGPATLLVRLAVCRVEVLSPAWDVPRARDRGVRDDVGVGIRLPARVAAAARGAAPIAFPAARSCPMGSGSSSSALGAEPADGEGLIVPPRLVRTPEELARIRHAAAIATWEATRYASLRKPACATHGYRPRSSLRARRPARTTPPIASHPARASGCDRPRTDGSSRATSSSRRWCRATAATLRNSVNTFVLGEPGGTGCRVRATRRGQRPSCVTKARLEQHDADRRWPDRRRHRLFTSPIRCHWRREPHGASPRRRS